MKKRYALILAFLSTLCFSAASLAEVWYVQCDILWIWTQTSGKDPGPIYFNAMSQTTPAYAGSVTMYTNTNNHISATMKIPALGNEICSFDGDRKGNVASGTYFCAAGKKIMAEYPWTATISP